MTLNLTGNQSTLVVERETTGPSGQDLLFGVLLTPSQEKLLRRHGDGCGGRWLGTSFPEFLNE